MLTTQIDTVMYKKIKMEIIILRHGKPKIPPLKRLNASDFVRWVASYNIAGLCSSSTPTNDAISLAKSCNTIVCSELKRSIESASALGFNEVSLKSSQFNEAGIPIANWAAPRLSPKVWAAFFRILWLLGYSKNYESFKEAKCRASLAAKLLIKLANKHGRVLLVGHGVYNKFLAKELKSLGWSDPKNPGSKYWSLGVYGGTKT